MATKIYYLIDDTTIHPLIKTEGEFMVVLDENKKPIWHYDYSDGYINISVVMPKTLTEITGPNPTLENIDAVPKRLANAVDKYLKTKGY